MCNMDTVTTHRWQSSKDVRSQEGLAEEHHVYLCSPVLGTTVYGHREICYQKHRKRWSYCLEFCALLFFFPTFEESYTLSLVRSLNYQVDFFCDAFMIYVTTCFRRVPETGMLLCKYFIKRIKPKRLCPFCKLF